MNLMKKHKILIKIKKKQNICIYICKDKIEMQTSLIFVCEDQVNVNVKITTYFIFIRIYNIFDKI